MTKEEQIRALYDDIVREGDVDSAIACWECQPIGCGEYPFETCVTIPNFYHKGFIYRRKPRTFRLGNVDVPWPLEEMPNQDHVYSPDMSGDRKIRCYFTNMNDAACVVKQKIAHTTEEAAILHSQGLISANRIALGLEVLEVE